MFILTHQSPDLSPQHVFQPPGPPSGERQNICIFVSPKIPNNQDSLSR